MIDFPAARASFIAHAWESAASSYPPKPGKLNWRQLHLVRVPHLSVFWFSFGHKRRGCLLGSELSEPISLSRVFSPNLFALDLACQPANWCFALGHKTSLSPLGRHMAAATGWGLQSKPVLSRLEAHGAALNTLKPMAVSEPVYTHFVFLSSAANGTSREVWA